SDMPSRHSRVRKVGALPLMALALSVDGPIGSRLGAQIVTVFSHVNIVDARDSLPRRDQTVIVRGTRIVAAAPASTTSIPAGARVIDGRGRFLIPGLWDMHVHTAIVGGRELLGFYVANGVT